MRILDLNNGYSPEGGGIRVYHEEKLAYYGRRGDHAYALMVPGRRWKARREGAVVRYECPALPIPGTSSRMVLRAGPIARVIEDFRPDLIEIGSFDVLPAHVRRILCGRPVATVGFFHQDYPESYVRAPLARLHPRLGALAGRLAERHAARLYGGCTAAFGASAFAVGRLRELGVRRVLATPLGVDAATFTPERRSEALRAELGAVGGRRLVLFVGRLAPEKGIALLAEAYPRVADPSRFVLAVCGHGPFAGRLAPFFAARPEVRRLPFRRDRLSTAELLASADLVLSLGERETFSLVTLEAMACGTPVLAGGSGGAGELVAQAGVVPPFERTPAGLARGILGVLDLKDDATAARLRAFALGRYDWPRSLDHLHACYERVLAAFRSGDLASLES
ncbi:MAG TPA: glycosyltransferase [Candidatus Methanoperedens sp.]|nr:glycosyltransferase [Candidatus Methanoperedens sp.]